MNVDTGIAKWVGPNPLERAHIEVDASRDLLRQNKFLRECYLGIVIWTICKTWKISFLTRVKEENERYCRNDPGRAMSVRRFHISSRVSENFNREDLATLTGQPLRKLGRYITKKWGW